MSESTSQITDRRAKLLPRITGYFFDRPETTALIWLILVVFGVMSYTTLLRREGFPSVAIPLVIVNGSYAVNDPAKVDQVLGAPVSDIALKQSGVKSVQASSEDNFFSAVIQFDEGTDAVAAKAALQKAVEADAAVPKSAALTFSAPYFGVTGGSTDHIDATVAIYSASKQESLQQLTAHAQKAADYLNAHRAPLIDRYFVENPFQTVTNPATGKLVVIQKSFDRYGTKLGGETQFYPSVTIGVAQVAKADAIKFDNQIRGQLTALQAQPGFKDTSTAVTASYAPSIKQEISELQKVLLEGLAAVLIVGSIVIAVRASLITVISMVTVIATTLGVIYLLGYTLNVITLFALILGLSLIVDDTIIMVEAIDSAKRHTINRGVAVREAARKIGRAMIAATLTATLSFLPLAFVGGILGSFIRAIPVTIISALLVSLFAALIFIPLFARLIMLRKKNMGHFKDEPRTSQLETRIALGISRPMLWARHHRGREFMVGLLAVFVGLGFIGAGAVIFRQVPFNIFPPSKDTNQLSVMLSFPANTTVTQASQVAAQVDEGVGGVLGPNLENASYYGMANNRTATLNVNLLPYDKRSVTAPQLADSIKARFADFSAAKVTAAPVDVGPPSSSFVVDIKATDRAAAEKVAADMVQYLKGKQLVRPSGKVATITEAAIRNPGVYQRQDGQQILSVEATFDGIDTTTLTQLGQKAVNARYTGPFLQSFGLQAGDVTFNLGQESENQSSFKSLLVAFPLVLLAI